MDTDKDVCSVVALHRLRLCLILQLPRGNIMMICFLFWVEPGVQSVCWKEPVDCWLHVHSFEHVSVIGCRLDARKHVWPVFFWTLCTLNFTCTKWVFTHNLFKKIPGAFKATSTCLRPIRYLKTPPMMTPILLVGFCVVLSRFCWAWCNASSCFYGNWILMHKS